MIRFTKTGKINTVIILLFLSIIPLRYFDYHTDFFTANTIICILFTVIVFLWIYQIRRRVVHPAERKFLVAIAVLNLCLIIIRTMKYVFVSVGTAIERYIWYMYYIPVILSVLCMFLVSFYVGESYYMKLNRKYRLLAVPAVFLCFAIMTNDLHQQLFYFYGGLSEWSDSSSCYRKGILFYVVFGWIIIMIAGTLFNVIRKCIVKENRKKLWMPLLPFTAGICFLLFAREEALIKMPEIHCMIYPSIMEALIIAGLLPSNSRYREAWENSSVNLGMISERMEENGEYNPYHISCRQIAESLEKSTYIFDKDHELKSCRISGGYGFWIRDISQINRLKEKIKEYGDVLKEENAMLRAERKMEEEKIKIREQNRIYNSIVEKVYPELLNIYRVLREEGQNDEEFRKNITYASVLNVYIKRYSNMILTGVKGVLPSEELRFAVRESLEYLSLSGVRTHGEYHLSGNASAADVTGFYAFFQSIVEKYVMKSRGVLVYLAGTEGKLSMYIETDGKIAENEEKLMNTEIEKQGFVLDLDRDENTLYFTLKTGSDIHDQPV